MTDPVTAILGGVVLVFASGTVGKYLGSNGKVKDTQCEERRNNCITLVSEKIDNLSDRMTEMKKSIDRLNKP